MRRTRKTMNHTRIVGLGALAVAALVPASVHAQVGNMTYTTQELGRALSMFKVSADGPPGVDAVMMMHGKLLVLGTNDSGKGERPQTHDASVVHRFPRS